jgi:hypothetical protein
MAYYIKKCPNCGRQIHIHRKKRQLILKNVCEHVQNIAFSFRTFHNNDGTPVETLV